MLAVRRYGLPGIIAVISYLVLEYIFTPVQGLFWQGCIFSVLFSYLMRVCDDIGDFEKDAKKNKTVFGKRFLIFLDVCILLVLICGTVVWQMYFMLIPLAVIMSQFLLKGIFRKVVKVLFVPAVIFALFNTVFVFSYYMFIPIAYQLLKPFQFCF